LAVKSTHQLSSPVQVKHTNCKSNCNLWITIINTTLTITISRFRPSN